MKLSANFTAIRETVQEKVLNISATIREFCATQTNVQNSLFDIATLVTTCVARENGLIDSDELYDATLEMAKAFQNADPFSITLPLSVGDDNTESTALPGIVHVDTSPTIDETGFWIDSYIEVIDENDDVIDTIQLVYVQAVDEAIDDLFTVDLDEVITDYNFSLGTLCSDQRDTLTTGYVVETMLDLYNQDQLTVSNLITCLQGNIDLTTAHANKIIDVVIANLATILANPLSMINIVKGLLNSLLGFGSNGDVFTYPIDTYHVSTTIVVGWDIVSDVISSVVSIIGSIVSPIVGFAAHLIGAGVKAVVQVIENNESSLPVYPSYADFNGFGQNVKRGYVYGIDDSLIQFGEVSQTHGIVTPLFTTMLFNSPTQDSLHRTLYPIQEFIVPVLPISAAGWDKLFQIVLPIPSGVLNTTYNWITDASNNSYRTVRMTYAGSTPTSSDSRINRVIEYMKYLNDHPDEVWMANSEMDNDELVKFAVWLNYVLLQCAIGSLDNEYSSFDQTVRCDTMNNILRVYDPSTVRSAAFVQYFGGMVLLVKQAISESPYDPLEFTSMSNYLSALFVNGGSTSANMYKLKDLGCNLSWAELVNTALLSELLGVNAYATVFCSSTYINDTPVGLTKYLSSSTFTPSVVPPSHSLNIWARLAITTAIVAVAAVTAAIAYTKARKHAIVSFSKYANKATDSYQTYITTDDANVKKKAYRSWKINEFFGNGLGKIFRLGSIDSVNNWVNTPSASESTVFQKLSELSSGTEDQDPSASVQFSISDVLNIIKGTD